MGCCGWLVNFKQTYRGLIGVMAYFISGHGSDHYQYGPMFQVPPGCTIIVLAKHGEETLMVNGEVNVASVMCRLPLKMLENPLEHLVPIMDAFRPWGSLAIYREGEQCPNFSYTFDACYQMPEGDRCERVGSGLLDVAVMRSSGLCKDDLRDMISPDSFHDLTDIDHDTMVHDAIVFVSYILFRASVYPAPLDVFLILNTERSRRQITKARDFQTMVRIAKLVLTWNMAMQVSQKFLCSRFKGVFYNTVCRWVPDELGVPDELSMFMKNNDVTIFRKIRRPNLLYLDATNRQKSAMRNHISEAIMHRAPYVRNYYATKAATRRVTRSMSRAMSGDIARNTLKRRRNS